MRRNEELHEHFHQEKLDELTSVSSSSSGHQRLTEVLAENLQSKRGEARCFSSCLNSACVCVNCVCGNSLCCRAGDVSRGAGGDPGRHRTNTVRQDPGAALQTDLQMCLQPTLPGQNQTSGV